MRWVRGGTFRMGSNDFGPLERPAHDATVQGFWMDTHPVTVAEFGAFAEATGYATVAEVPMGTHHQRPGSMVFNPTSRRVDLSDSGLWWKFVPGASWRSPAGHSSTLIGLDKDPVVHVAYEDAAAYCAWAGKSLPTEAEWERAARGGLDSKIYAWGDDFSSRGRLKANTWQGEFPVQNLLLDGYLWTSPVHTFASNKFGLYDMTGNVWEWTEDLIAARDLGSPACCTPVEALDDEDDSGSPRHVVKGGSYLCSENCRHYRPAARYGQPGRISACHIGFRCVVRSRGESSDG